LVPPVDITFWAFRIMVGLGGYFILFFLIVTYLQKRETLDRTPWIQHVALWTIPLAYIAGQAGWVVAEVGRQPWAIQDMLPVEAAISHLGTGAVQVTFVIFLVLFTVMLAAEISILCKMIRKGPEEA
jgi:cytochrome d ubiquinol oxidase subunit I